MTAIKCDIARKLAVKIMRLSADNNRRAAMNPADGYTMSDDEQALAASRKARLVGGDVATTQPGEQRTYPKPLAVDITQSVCSQLPRQRHPSAQEVDDFLRQNRRADTRDYDQQ